MLYGRPLGSEEGAPVWIRCPAKTQQEEGENGWGHVGRRSTPRPLWLKAAKEPGRKADLPSHSSQIRQVQWVRGVRGAQESACYISTSSPHVSGIGFVRPTWRSADLVQAFDPSSSYPGGSPERKAHVESRISHTSLSDRLLGGTAPPVSPTPQGGMEPDPLQHLSPMERVQARSRHRHMPVRQLTNGWPGTGQHLAHVNVTVTAY